MKELFSNLKAALQGTDGGSKLVALLVGGAILAAVGVVGVVANKPDFSPAFVGLTAVEKNEVCKALGAEGLAFDVDPPPGPYTVYTDESDRYTARNIAYGAGALDRPVQGITTDPGVASVFMGDAARLQMIGKRGWQEVERMLEDLDFVVSATVIVFSAKRAPLGRTMEKATAAITLKVPGRDALTREHAKSVSRIAARSLGLLEENLTISDQHGNSPYDPGSDGEGDIAKGLLGIKQEYDRQATDTINHMLTMIYGPDKAYATVSSTWEYEQSTTRTESALEGPILTQSTNESTTPITGRAQAGGPTGLGSTLSDPGTGEVDGETGEVPSIPEATTKEERTEYQPARETKQSVRSQEVLLRQSIAVFLDSSLTSTPEFDETLKAAVGFDEKRKDTYSLASISFFVPPVVEVDASDETAVEEPSAPNPMLENLLRRGVEIAVALVFIVLLLKSLKSSKKNAAEAAAAAKSSQDEAQSDIDPELLARMQVEELLKADPDQVGRILASWARDDQTAGAA